MSHCKVIVRKGRRIALLRSSGDLVVPSFDMNGTPSAQNVVEGLRDTLGPYRVRKLQTQHDTQKAYLVDLAENETCPIPAPKGNPPQWLDARMIADQSIGFIAKQVDLSLDSSDFIRRNFVAIGNC